MNKFKFNVLICGGTGCKASASSGVFETFATKLSELSLNNDVQVITTGCFGFCEQGPIVKIMPDNTFYVKLQPLMLKRLLKNISSKVVKLIVCFIPTPKRKLLSATQSTWAFTKNNCVSL